MRPTEKRSIGQEFTTKYLTSLRTADVFPVVASLDDWKYVCSSQANISPTYSAKKGERRRLVEGERSLSMASDYSNPDNTRKRTLKRQILKKTRTE